MARTQTKDKNIQNRFAPRWIQLGLFLSLLVLESALTLSQANAHDLAFRSGGSLNKIGQIEWITNENLSDRWRLIQPEPHEIKAYLFASTQEISAPCRSKTTVLRPECLRQFGMVSEYPHLLGGKSRFSYHSFPELTGKIWFFTLLANFTRGELSVSDVGSVDFDEARSLDLVPRPSIYDGTQPETALPNTSTYGDICVSGERGNNANSGLCPNAPVQTIERALEILRSRYPTRETRAGKTILVRQGTYKEGLNLIGLEGMPGAHITLRGYPGEEVVLSQYTTNPNDFIARYGALPTDLNRWSKEILGGYYGINLDGAKHVTIENLRIEGARMEGVNIDNVTDVKVRFVDVLHAGKWGMQAFGRLQDLTVEGCRVIGTLFTWVSEHGIYISPVHNPGEPLSRRIVLRNNRTAYNGRAGIQVNGVAQDVLIENNVSLGNMLGGINLYGISGAVVRNNIAQGNNQQPFVAFTYFDESYFRRDYNGGSDVNRWRATRFSTSAYVTVTHNTFITGPTAAFSNAQRPSDMDTIRFHEGAGTDNAGEPIAEPFYAYEVNNNVLWGMNSMNPNFMISAQERDYRGQRMIEGIRVENNLIYSSSANGVVRAKLPWQAFNELHTPLTEMEQNYPSNWRNNLLNRHPELMGLAQIREVVGREYMLSRFDSLHQFDLTPSSTSPVRGRAGLIRYSSGLLDLLGRDFYGQQREVLRGIDLGAVQSR